MMASLADSYRHCERIARREAGNFYHAFRVLPRVQQRSMCALYAFLRITDDLSDADEPAPIKQQKLADWRGRLDLALAGRDSHPIHRAVHDMVNRHHIPAKYLHDVFDGVEMDLERKQYANFNELYSYCYKVASVVGLACIRIWGTHDKRADEYAEEAGIALQLTNILRDLKEDAARQRVYLPEEDLVRFGYSAECLASGIRNDAFRALMCFQVERARSYYRASLPLEGLLSPAGRAVFRIMTRTYSGLLDAIERSGYDVFSKRVRLSRWHKWGLVVQAVPARLGWS
jgi:phytoene synthase